MGGFITPAATIGGTEQAPSIPFDSNPESGLYETDSNGFGLSLEGNQYENIDTINASLGRVSTIPSEISDSPYVTGTTPTQSIHHPLLDFVYAINEGDSSITGWSSDPATGELSDLSNSPFALTDAPGQIVIDPLGRFLYVTLPNTGEVEAFEIDQVNGDLSAIAGSPFTISVNLAIIAVNATSEYLLVTLNTSDELETYAIDQGDGSLSFVIGSNISAATVPVSLASNSTGDFVYYGAQNFISAFVLDTGTGLFTETSGSPFAITENMVKLVTDPSGNFLYVLSNNNAGDESYLAAFEIDQGNGNLTEISGSPLTVNSIALDIAADPNGTYLYLTSTFLENSLSVYEYGDDGLPSLFTDPLTLSFGQSRVATDSHYLYLTDPDNDRLHVDRSSRMYPIYEVTFDPDGWTGGVFNVNGTLLVNGQGLAGTGTVTSVSVTTANGVSAIVTDPTTAPVLTFTLGAITPDSVNGAYIGEGANPGNSNVLLGDATTAASNTGSGNTIVGANAGAALDDGSGNTAIGNNALSNADAGNENVALGDGALLSITSGNSNIGIGASAASENTTGEFNIAIGEQALGTDTSGSYNLCIGYLAGNFIDGDDYNLVIDNTGTGTGTPLVGGNFDPAGGLDGLFEVNGTLLVNNAAGEYEVGFKTVPQNLQVANYTLDIADVGKSMDHPASDANNRTFTIDSFANVGWEIGTCISFTNMSANALTIAITTDTLRLAGAGTTGSRTLGQYGQATARLVSIDGVDGATETTWLIGGSNLT